jgi:penicillin-binding protein 1C
MKRNRIIKWAGLILGFGIGIGVAFLITASEGINPPSFDQVKGSYQKSDALLLDRYGRIIHELRISSKGRRLEWIDLRAVSPALLQAVLQVEDRRFYRHQGVDWTGIFSSVLKNPWSPGARGASTITMQLVSLLDKKLRTPAARRTLKQKWNQIRSARALERSWSKAQILEAYLNLVSYRSELQGMAAASRGLFLKEPSGLNEAESLILASLIASPNAPVERIIKRACFLARSLAAQTDCQTIEELGKSRLQPPYPIKPAMALAPQVAQILLKENEVQIVSTLDGRLQQFALETLNHYLADLKEGHVSDGAVLVIDNRSGEILAYVGNSGQTSSALWVDGITALRQAGSTLKPFLYELAIEKGLLTTASLLEDSPLQIPTSTGLYVPQNYEPVFRGWISARTALSASLNIPAVRTLFLVGLNSFWDRLKQLGLSSLSEEAEYYGYSLALGSADISLYELTNAYRTLANGGRSSPLRLRLDQTAKKPIAVMDKRAAYIISHILSDRGARSPTFGLENPLATRFWTAAKTGTSKDMRDNWCLGYSERYTVGVWLGNFSGEPMRNVSGVSGAAPIWLAIMNYLHSDRPSHPPQPPEGLIVARVAFHPEVEPPREDFFMEGTEPGSSVQAGSPFQKPRITSPTDEMLIHLDPEIPEELQRVPFRFLPSAGRYQWMINDQKTSIFDPFFLWKPERGNYVVSIIDRENRVVDSVEFRVK